MLMKVPVVDPLFFCLEYEPLIFLNQTFKLQLPSFLGVAMNGDSSGRKFLAMDF